MRVRAPEPVRLSREEARRYLVGQHGLHRAEPASGEQGARTLLVRRRCIQLDPLDPLGTNADLVALARVDGLARGDIYRHLYPGHAFEHFAKERCLLPPEAFPWYRDWAPETSWWRTSERLRRLPKGLVDDVLAEIRERGPTTVEALSDRGRVQPLAWQGWTGTGRATSMAIEVLWTRCEIVVCGRSARGKVYDVPERALPGHASAPAVLGAAPDERGARAFARWALLERVEAAGLLARAAGATWSMLSDVRTSSLPDRLLEEGRIEEVIIEGSRRRYLAPARRPHFWNAAETLRERRFAGGDDRLRILGPLDSMLWDRDLVRQVFGFDYVWEVYKPAGQRRWGWYVCPLLHRGRLVGRIDGAIDGKVLRVRKIWGERGAVLDQDALNAALDRHAAACGADGVVRPARVSRSAEEPYF